MPYDMLTVIESIVDDGDFLQVQELFAANIICGFGRVEGRSVGVVANQPMQFAGTLDIDASEKAARFVRNCDAFNIPVLTFVDVPGFLPGTAQEHNGIIKHGAMMINAVSNSKVPHLSVLMGASYGAGHYGMCGRAYDPRFLFAWPSAKSAVMGAAQLAGVISIVSRAASPRRRSTSRRSRPQYTPSRPRFRPAPRASRSSACSWARSSRRSSTSTARPSSALARSPSRRPSRGAA